MRVLVAFDKFKDALTAAEACAAAAGALRAKHPDWTVDLCPLTDGGEGFAETLTASAGGSLEARPVTGPRGEPVDAVLGFVPGARVAAAVRRRLQLDPDRALALIGLAAASGLERLPPARRDLWQTSTVGTGELLRAAGARDVGAILLGVGGSATHDLGCGALAALGVAFLDADGARVDPPVPAAWDRISRVDLSRRVVLPPLFIACDVDNPLLGPRGAAATFGPQKGLRPEDLARLEFRSARMAGLLCAACDQPPALAETPGAGAAGGIAFGLLVAAGARLVPGFDLVSAWLDLPARLATADLVVTGEGRFDATSLGGKGPGSLVRAAHALGKPVQVFAGSLGMEAGATRHAITPANLPLAAALPRTAELLAAAVARVL
jgi:glycerate kinase